MWMFLQRPRRRKIQENQKKFMGSPRKTPEDDQKRTDLLEESEK